jgi:hypothetical protein
VTLSGRFVFETGSQNFKMAAAKQHAPAIPDITNDPIASIALATVDIREAI